jgi:hypothetical protein
MNELIETVEIMRSKEELIACWVRKLVNTKEGVDKS